MVNVGWNTLTLKPSSGGLEQLVTNFSSLRFSSSVKPSTTSQKIWMTGWVAEYPPKGGKTALSKPYSNVHYALRLHIFCRLNSLLSCAGVCLCASFKQVPPGMCDVAIAAVHTKSSRLWYSDVPLQFFFLFYSWDFFTINVICQSFSPSWMQFVCHFVWLCKKCKDWTVIVRMIQLNLINWISSAFVTLEGFVATGRRTQWKKRMPNIMRVTGIWGVFLKERTTF